MATILSELLFLNHFNDLNTPDIISVLSVFTPLRDSDITLKTYETADYYFDISKINIIDSFNIPTIIWMCWNWIRQY